MSMKGKVAIVTGAGRGFGRAIALALACEGADLVIVSRTASELERTAQSIMAAGGTVAAVAGDVGEAADVVRAVTTAVETFGSVDILVNNAGSIGPTKPLVEVTEAEWDRTMATNLKGAYLFARAVAPHMIRQKSGKIINVTSGLGEMVLSPFGVYSVTKAALIHLTRFLAEELRVHNIQVNGLDPSVLDTRMQEEIRGFGPAVLGIEVYDSFAALKTHGRLLPPETVAPLAVFLASAQADRITGEIGTANHFRKFGYRPG